MFLFLARLASNQLQLCGRPMAGESCSGGESSIHPESAPTPAVLLFLRLRVLPPSEPSSLSSQSSRCKPRR